MERFPRRRRPRLQIGRADVRNEPAAWNPVHWLSVGCPDVFVSPVDTIPIRGCTVCSQVLLMLWLLPWWWTL